jgi:hypothetical protein
MRRFVLLLLVLLSLTPRAEAQVLRAVALAATGTVRVIWDPNPDGVTTGYVLFWGVTQGAEDEGAVDVPGSSSNTVQVSGLLPGRVYFFHIRAYNAATVRGPSSNEISFLVPSDPCAFPLGATSVSIFVTGKLNKTGSGGANSRASITFQAFSPNSPIDWLSIRANGVDIPDSVASATGPTDKLNSPGALWFTMPQGPATYSFSVYGRNRAGCAREQPTGFTTTVP